MLKFKINIHFEVGIDCHFQDRSHDEHEAWMLVKDQKTPKRSKETKMLKRPYRQNGPKIIKKAKKEINRTIRPKE